MSPSAFSAATYPTELDVIYSDVSKGMLYAHKMHRSYDAMRQVENIEFVLTDNVKHDSLAVRAEFLQMMDMMRHNRGVIYTNHNIMRERRGVTVIVAFQMVTHFWAHPVYGSSTTPNVTFLQAAQAVLDMLPDPTELRTSETTELIVGYRDFVFDNDDWCLKSRNGAIWPARERMYSLCGNNVFVSHDAPDEACTCGIYAFDDPKHKDMNLSGRIWGEVYLWGKVLVCHSGYRAEYAYPKSIFIRDDHDTKAVRYLRDRFEDDYGVPVMLLKTREGKTINELMDEQLSKMLNEGGENNISH